MQREAHSRSDGQRGTILEHSWRSESRTRESLSRPKKAEASQNLNEQIQAGQRTLLDHSGGDLLEVLCQMGIKHLSDLEHFWLLLYLHEGELAHCSLRQARGNESVSGTHPVQLIRLAHVSREEQARESDIARFDAHKSSMKECNLHDEPRYMLSSLFLHWSMRSL